MADIKKILNIRLTPALRAKTAFFYQRNVARANARNKMLNEMFGVKVYREDYEA